MKNAGLLSSRDSAFYIGSLIIIIQYLHERDILYRDLKPENIMIDHDGYVKLIDFNSAKKIAGKTFTLVGCPYYMAPEVITGRGYGKSAEIWSLGVLLYELLCGRVPFGQNLEDPYQIYEDILESKLSFPDDIILLSEASRSLINYLLNKFKDRHTGPIEDLQKNDFFSNFNWEDLYSKKIIPPFKPDVPNPTDCDDDDGDESESWDEMLNNDSQDSSNSIPEINDDEIALYKSQIQPDWDKAFG